MLREDVPAFEKLLGEVAECFDKKAPSGAAMKHWFEAVKGHQFTTVELALRTWLRTKSKFPTIAEMVGALADAAATAQAQRAQEERKSYSQAVASILHAGPTDHGRSCSAAVRSKLSEIGRRPPTKAWARELVRRARVGQPLHYIQIQMALEALGLKRIPEREPGEDEDERAAESA